MCKQHIWMFLGLLTLAAARAKGRMITCRSSPGESNTGTEVTFVLPEDVNETKKNFTVYHYNDQSFLTSVLRCLWKSGKRFCMVADGYTFDWKISTSFVLTIPSLSAHQTGFYACQIAGYGVEDIQPCTVHFKQATDFKCSWQTKGMLCRHGDNYNFEMRVTKGFTLDVPSVSNETTGVYSCSPHKPHSVSELNMQETMQGGTTCDIGAGISMAEATLTCHFQQDVFQQKKNIAVYYYTEKAFPDVVVNCTWTNAELVCSSKSGYLWNKTAVSDHMTFSVPRAIEGQPRMYACEVQGYNVNLTKSCWDIIPRDEMRSQAFSASGKITADLKPSSHTDKRNQTCWISSAHLKTKVGLTCQFPGYLSGFRKNVLVSHHNNQGYDDAVAFCSWLNNSLQCLAKTGYTWDTNLYPDRLIIYIPRVVEENTGSYTCEVPTSEYQLGLCRVTSESGGSSTDQIFPVSTGSRFTPINKTSISTDLSVVCSPSLVTEGQQAAVICTLGTVMAAHSFVILHYSLSNTDVPDIPLVCLRTAGGLECEVHDGYEYDIIVNNFTAILRLPHVSNKDLGTYTCTTVTSNSGHASCTLTFSVKNLEGLEESGSFFWQHKVFISGGVGAVIATAVTVSICIFIMYKKGHTRYQYPQRQPESNKDPYKKLPAVGYEKTTGIEEDTSSYAEVGDSPPSQRTTKAETKILIRESGLDATPPAIMKDRMNTSLKVESVSLSELPLICQLPEHREPPISDLADLPKNLIRHDSLTGARGEKNSLTQMVDNNEGGYLKPRDRSSNDQAVQVLCTQDETFPRLSGIQAADRKQNPPQLPPPRAADITVTKKFSSQSQHSSESRMDQDEENCSPPGQSQYYLHPVDDVACTYLHHSSLQSHGQSRDLSAETVAVHGDMKNGDERDDPRCLRGSLVRYMQPLNLSHNSSPAASGSGSNQSLAPENRHPVYENNAE